jgi:hypothetical protein
MRTPRPSDGNGASEETLSEGIGFDPLRRGRDYPNRSPIRGFQSSGSLPECLRTV